MSKAQSEALKRNWAKLSFEQRSKILSDRMKKRWSKVGKKERRLLALKLVEARNKHGRKKI